MNKIPVVSHIIFRHLEKRFCITRCQRNADLNARTDRSRRVVNDTLHCAEGFRCYRRERTCTNCSVDSKAPCGAGVGMLRALRSEVNNFEK